MQVANLEKCASGKGNDASVSSQITSRKAQLRAPLSPLQTAWTSFNPYLIYSSGSFSAGPALVENSKVFILNRDIVTNTMSAIPPEPGWCAVHSTPPRLLSARLVPCGWAYRPTVKVQCLSTCLPPKHPNSLWLSYRPRVVGIDTYPLQSIPTGL